MRHLSTLIAMLALAGTASADPDGIRAGAAVGAGGQGTALYSALEVQLDAAWRSVRVGLGARGVWENGVFRRSDWSRPIDAVTIVRMLEAALVLDTDRDGRTTAQLAIAAGGLAPSRIAHVVDGHRATLDDRQRTGARGALSTRAFELGLEIDDVIDPALIGGAVAWQLAPPWGIHAAVAVDPGATRPGSAVELGVAHRWDAKERRIELGGAVVGEPREGVSGVGFGSIAVEWRGARWTTSADLRGGNGTTGALFGPLYRVERLGLIDRAHGGIGGGLSFAVAAPAISVALSARARPGLGALATAAIAAPMGRWVQAGGWIAASRAATAGAAELRIAWARRLSSALQVARMYTTDDPMQPAASWSLTAWFAGTTH